MKIAILGSGAWFECPSIINASDSNQLGNAEIVGIFSDMENAPILLMLRKNTFIPSISTLVNTLNCRKRRRSLVNEIKEVNPDLIVLAGFMRIFEAKFINLLLIEL